MTTTASPPRVGVIYERGSTWDQVGPAVATGFASHGATVTLIGVEMGWLAGRLLVASSHFRGLTRGDWPLIQMQNARAGVAVRRAPEVDFWIQMGSTLPYLAPRRYATYEDMTVKLAFEDVLLAHMRPRTRRSWQARQRRVYAGAARCYLASDWAAASVSSDFGVPADKISVIGMGQELPVPETMPVKDWERPTFLWVGRDWERKNGPAVVKAFSGLRQEHPAATLHLVGHHPEITAEGVVSHGWLQRSDAAQLAELSGLFTAATCFVMPSRLEPFGLVYLEANANGAACIGTTGGGAPTAVGQGGICVDPNDPAALDAAMRKMCDPASARAYGEAGWGQAAHFTWSRVTGQMLSDLAPLGSSPRRSAEGTR